MKEKILELRVKGYTYDQIQQELGCSKGTISYHCGDGQKEKTKTRSLKNWKNLIYKKIYMFNQKHKDVNKISIDKNSFFIIRQKIYSFRHGDKSMDGVTLENFLEKYENKAITCYLTGETIDITKPRTYEFDHIIPRSRGGDNSIENLGICIKKANRSKNDMTHKEFLELCKKVVSHHENQSEKQDSNL